MANNKGLQVGDEVVINNPSSKFHRFKGVVKKVTENWTMISVEVLTGKHIDIIFPTGRYLLRR